MRILVALGGNALLEAGRAHDGRGSNAPTSIKRR